MTRRLVMSDTRPVRGLTLKRVRQVLVHETQKRKVKELILSLHFKLCKINQITLGMHIHRGIHMSKPVIPN